MKKNGLLSDDIWVFQTFEAGTGTPASAPDATHETMFRDEGDPFPLADAAGSVFNLEVSAGKPVASIATLADYLVNGFWQYNSTPAHHWASNTISYNITGLNSAEQFLAQTAMQAWSEVANITFVQTSGAANITFTHNGTMQAYTSGSWSGSGAIAYQTVNISTDWITTDGGANDGKTGIDSYAYQTYIHEIGHALGLGHQGPYNGSASYSTNAVYANDTWQYSIMSYFSEHELFREFVPLRRDAADGGHLRRGFDVRRGDLDANRRHRLWLQQQRRRGVQFRRLHLGAGADHLRQRRQRHARLLRLFGGADHRPARGRLFLGRRPYQQYRDRAQRGHRESHWRQRQRHADRKRHRLVRCRAAAATTR